MSNAGTRLLIRWKQREERDEGKRMEVHERSKKLLRDGLTMLRYNFIIVKNVD
jgi:hypothetical protein